MQVHLDTPQANLNAGVRGEEQDLYQQHSESKKTLNLMICNGIAVCVRRRFWVLASGLPNMFNFRVRLSETDCSSV